MSKLWAVWCDDSNDVAEARRRTGGDHSAHLNASPIKLVLAGPLTSDDGTTSTGSLLVFEAEDRQAVETQMQADPFVLSGVWASFKIAAFKKSRENFSRADKP